MSCASLPPRCAASPPPRSSRSISALSAYQLARARRISPASSLAACGSRSGPSTISATAPTSSSSKKPTSNTPQEGWAGGDCLLGSAPPSPPADLSAAVWGPSSSRRPLRKLRMKAPKSPPTSRRRLVPNRSTTIRRMIRSCQTLMPEMPIRLPVFVTQREVYSSSASRKSTIGAGTLFTPRRRSGAA